MRLNQITVSTTNISRAIRFYQELGLQLIVHTSDDYARFWCPDGNATFSLHKVDRLPEVIKTTVYFEVDHLDEKVKDLEQVGIEFDVQPVDQPWLWREARLHDPDGNPIILYHAGVNRINPPWRRSDPELAQKLRLSYGISHVATVFQVQNLDRSIDFYTKTLSFDVTFTWGDPIDYAVIKMGPIQIHLILTEGNVHPIKPFRSIYIFTRQVDDLYNSWKDKGVSFQAPLTTKPYGMMDFDVIDPDGHVLTFGQHKQN